MENKVNVYYYSREGILEGRINCIVGQEDHVLTPEELAMDPYKAELYKDALIYEGADPIMCGYPIPDPVNLNYVRTATVEEMIERGVYECKDGEYIEDNKLVTVPKPNHFAKWDHIEHVWVTKQSELPTGYIIEDPEKQTIKMIERPNRYATWIRDTGTWYTNPDLLIEGEILTEDGTIKVCPKPKKSLYSEYTIWENDHWVDTLTDEVRLERLEQHAKTIYNKVIVRGLTILSSGTSVVFDTSGTVSQYMDLFRIAYSASKEELDALMAENTIKINWLNACDKVRKDIVTSKVFKEYTVPEFQDMVDAAFKEAKCNREE